MEGLNVLSHMHGRKKPELHSYSEEILGPLC